MKFHKESKSEKKIGRGRGEGVSKSVLTKNPVLKDNTPPPKKKKKKKWGVGGWGGGWGRG